MSKCPICGTETTGGHACVRIGGAQLSKNLFTVNSMSREQKIETALKLLKEAGVEIGIAELHGIICIEDKPPMEFNEFDTVIVIPAKAKEK